jgi:hypothetical protein
MKRYIQILMIGILASWVTLMVSCKGKPVEDQNNKAKDMPLVIGNPLDYGIRDILIFPVGASYQPMVFEKERNEISVKTNLRDATTLNFATNSSAFNDRLAKQEYINVNEDVFDIRNILFYDLKTGKTVTLINDTVHILSFALHREFSSPKIFYRVVKKDVNKDRIFNSADAVMLYVSNEAGDSLVQVTPENEQFVDYFYYAQTNTMLIKTVIDVDHDGRFTISDETNFRELKIGNPGMAREIFTKSLKDSLRHQSSIK